MVDLPIGTIKPEPDSEALQWWVILIIVLICIFIIALCAAAFYRYKNKSSIDNQIETFGNTGTSMLMKNDEADTINN